MHSLKSLLLSPKKKGGGYISETNTFIKFAIDDNQLQNINNRTHIYQYQLDYNRIRYHNRDFQST